MPTIDVNCPDKTQINKDDTILVLDRNLEEMLISAARYACGRRTYIVQDTVRYILDLLPFLSDWCIGVMQEDLRGKFIMCDRSYGVFGLGDPCDREQWELLRDKISEEINNRKGGGSNAT